MSCKITTPAPGITMFSCSRRETNPCSSCGARSTKLCDFPLTGAKGGTTCDRPLCSRCASTVGKDRDYCPAHARMETTK